MDFIIERSLVLYLPLYELDGASFISGDKHGHLGSVTGALWTPRGRSFDGVDDYISVPGSGGQFVFGTGDFTIQMWIRPDLINGKWRLLLCNGTVDDFGAGLSNAVNATISAFIGGTAHHSGALTWTLGQFYFIVVKRINGMVKISRDLVEILSQSNTTSCGKTSALDIGYDSYRSDYAFKGLIGEYWIYNRGLSVLEDQHNYLATKWRYL